uniref:Uncharacterized protein n=1 Tax=Ovis aries TaxID=9940 RepID=A0AC11DYU7_SHEEP
MALVGLPLVLLFLVGDSAGTHSAGTKAALSSVAAEAPSDSSWKPPSRNTSLNAQFSQHSEHRTPNCDQYKLPGCPRDFSPVCGSDMSTYPNECILCMKISLATRTQEGRGRNFFYPDSW